MRLLTAGDCARILAVSRSTIYRAVNTGSLRAIRVERGVRIPTNELVRYVSESSGMPVEVCADWIEAEAKEAKRSR